MRIIYSLMRRIICFSDCDEINGDNNMFCVVIYIIVKNVFRNGILLREGS